MFFLRTALPGERMIVQCDACSTKFRLDDSKVTAKGVKVRCTKCQNVFVVMPPSPPQEEAAPKAEESFDASFGTQPEPSSPAAEKEAGGFSFEAPSTKEEEKKAEPSQWGMDFTFEEKPKEEKKPEWDIGFKPAKEESPPSFEEKKEAPKSEESPGFEISGGFAPSFETEKKEAAAPSEEPLFSFEERKPDSLGFSFDAGLPPAGEKTSFEIEPPPTEEEFVVSIKEEAKTVVMRPPPVIPPPAQSQAGGLLGRDVGGAKEISFEIPGKRPAAKQVIILLLIILLIIAGGAAVYLNMGTGFLEKFTAIETKQKTMDLIGLKGSYTDNTSIGRLFVIEGKVVSNLAGPKEVKGIHGILFNKSGAQVKDAWVAPGRLISQNELKVISRTELEKRFKDRKGTIPPNGTVPFMIVFSGIPSELAEFTVEVEQ